ncbi:DegT/DnrJ/EryC1/StrS aminotransferase [Pseudogulbenkiania sp. NH8B]|uniref:DegT/DnrJ/EryC1/StrS family aminotransferase n=1 Tax=Pseudogulbenkiania sp. (strain NH8B) TaxID=748280 RepID=UPI000227A5A8|nr:DegT/DnrJ/EryC1/StrS family aminotransferase [Pseudogulbenkiania sp. NH8B]BAK78307.1 DegT/DnrJ/EryC1/StrS aminotransferase [Pseudogulbenkiania sp. NH8B]
MNDFKAEPNELKTAMLNSAERVIESGWYVLGKEVENFEREWASKCGTNHAIGVANGMDAIEIILRSLSIGPGDEVITTPMTAFASVLAIFRAGATPVLADIDPESAHLSIESVKRCINAKTKAILLVHLYGQIRNIRQWQSLAKSSDIYLIEDCAQAHLAKLEGKTAGSFGVAGAYSFYPTKNLGAPGDAGMLVTDDGHLANMAACLRNYGQSVRYFHPEIGLNSRLDEMHAAILSARLKWLDNFTARRREIASRYYAEITAPYVRLMAKPQELEAHVYHLFVLLCPQRDALQKHLEHHGIQALIHYPVPIHLQESCLSIKRDPAGLEFSEEHARCCLSIPCHPQMSDVDVTHVITSINAFQAI